MKKKKNGKIEFLRFLFTMAVILYHCQRHYLKGAEYLGGSFSFFAHGYLGVEFFFLVTGFLMAKAACKNSQASALTQRSGTRPDAALPDLGQETFSFVWKKMKAILPYHFSAFGILLVVTAVCEQQSLKEFVKSVFHSLPGIFLFSKAGADFGNLNRVEWYIFTMIYALFVLYPLCRRYYSMFTHVIAPVGGLFLLGYLITNYGSVVGGGASSWNGVIHTCMLRALAEIALGAACFAFSARIAAGSQRYTGMQRILLTLLENFCYLFSFLFIVSTLDAKYNIYVLLALFLGIALTFSGVTYGSRMFDSRPIYFLGSASLILYLSQVLPLDMVKRLVPDWSGYAKTVLMVLLTVLNACFCKMPVLLFERIFFKKKQRVKL